MAHFLLTNVYYCLLLVTEMVSPTTMETLMNKFQKIALAIGTMSFIAIAPVGNAIPITITGASFTAGSGYGTETNENSGTLLDVQFSTSIFSAQNFALNAPAEFFTFTFGTVNFLETDAGSGANAGIKSQETDNLGVTASFTFTDPLGITKNVLATGVATAGSVSDLAVDYTLVWAPVQVAFGTGGAIRNCDG